MKVDDLPDIDFTSCDCCRQVFSRKRPPFAIGIGQGHPADKVLVLGLCAACMLAMGRNTNRAEAAAAGERASATARLRPGRLRAIA